MAQVVDSVCGMTVDMETAPCRAEYKGKTYYFCNYGCKRRFEEDPAGYSAGAQGWGRRCECVSERPATPKDRPPA